MLADVAHHQPVALERRHLRAVLRHRYLLDEGDVPPGSGAESRRCCRSCAGQADRPLGRLFHSLQATSQALQPMQSVVSVKKP